MLSFIDNFMTPLQIPAGAEEILAPFSLPDGEYYLTMADSATAPSRHEAVFAWSEDGEVWIWRSNEQGLPEWPEGSVIFCGINSMVLQEILYQIEDGRSEPYKSIIGGGRATLSARIGLIDMPVSAGTKYLDIDPDQPPGTVVEHLVLIDFYTSGTLRISGNGRPIVRAQIQSHPHLTFSMDPGGDWVDINTSAHTQLRMRLQTDVVKYDAEAVHIIATFEDLGQDFTALSSPAP